MAVYHLHAKTVARTSVRAGVGGAAPATAKANYILREAQYQGQADPILRSGSENMPSWARACCTDYWARADAGERDNGRLYKYVEVALMVELTLDQNERLLREFLRDACGGENLPYTWAIHAGGGTNPHAHVMISERINDGIERLPQNWFRRHSSVRPETGGAAKSESLKPEEWLHDVRMAWQDHANRALQEEGFPQRIDHRSYAARGIDLEPQPKIGREFEEADRANSAALQNRRELLRAAAEANGDRLIRSPEEALRLLTENQAVFTRKELHAFVDRNSSTPEQQAELLHKLYACPGLVEAGLNARGQEHFTTIEMVEAEQSVKDLGQSLAARQRHEVAGSRVRRAIEKRGLRSDQPAALQHITGASGLSILEGYAGTGKSYMLGAAREAWEAQGLVPIGVSIAGKAAEGLEEGSGISSRTLAGQLFIWDKGWQTLTNKHVVVVDEAGMVGTRTMRRLLAHADKAGAKVVLVGDTNQLGAVDAGTPMESLIADHGRALMADIFRQKDKAQLAISNKLASQSTEEALGDYRQLGKVHAHVSTSDAYQAVVRRWNDDQREVGVENALMLAYRRADVAALNETARAALLAEGKLGRSKHLAGIDIAKGERLYFLKNDTDPAVKNGTLGTVLSIRGAVVKVRLDGDKRKVVEVNTRAYGHIQHGYAATVHKGQGVTVDRSVVLASRAMNQAATYVAMTRHKYDTELHWAAEEFAPKLPSGSPDLRDLAGAEARMVSALSREEDKRTALECLSAPIGVELGGSTLREMAAYRHADTLGRGAMRRDQELLARTTLTVDEAMLRVPEYRAVTSRYRAAKLLPLKRRKLRLQLVELSKDPRIVGQANTLHGRHVQRREQAQELCRRMDLFDLKERRNALVVREVHEHHARGEAARTRRPSDEGRILVFERNLPVDGAQLAVLTDTDTGAKVLFDVTGHKSAAGLTPGRAVRFGKGARWIAPVPAAQLSPEQRQQQTIREAAHELATPSGAASHTKQGDREMEQATPQSQGKAETSATPRTMPSRTEQAQAQLARVERTAEVQAYVAEQPPEDRLRTAEKEDDGERFVLRGVIMVGEVKLAQLASSKGETVAFDVTTHDKAMARVEAGDVVRFGKGQKWIETAGTDVTRVAERAALKPELTEYEQKAVQTVARHAELERSVKPRPYTLEDAYKELPEIAPVAKELERAVALQRGAVKALEQATSQGIPVDREKLSDTAMAGAESAERLSDALAILKADPKLKEHAEEQLKGLNTGRSADRRELMQLTRKLDAPARQAAQITYLHDLNRKYPDRPQARTVGALDNGKSVTFEGTRKLEGGVAKVALLKTEQGKRLIQDVTHSPWATKGLTKGQEVQLGKSQNGGKGVYIQRPTPEQGRGR